MAAASHLGLQLRELVVESLGHCALVVAQDRNLAVRAVVLQILQARQKRRHHNSVTDGARHLGWSPVMHTHTFSSLDTSSPRSFNSRSRTMDAL
jgi:hypothetical protein